MHNEHHLDLQVEPVKLGDGKLDGYKVAHFTGNVKFHLTEGQEAELKKFAENGGLLIVDSCGGSGEFASAVETEMATLFGPDAQQLQRALPAVSSVFAAVAP